MMHTLPLRSIPILVACLSLFSPIACARVWTSSAGTEMEADFMKVTGDTVHLKTPDGRVLEVPMAKLVPDDQLHIQDLLAAASGEESPFSNGAFTEDFVEVSTKWWKWSPNLTFVDGFAEARNDEIVWLEWTRPMKEDFELSMVLSREGPHTYPMWDFGIALVDTGVCCGLRLGADEHLVYVTSKSADNMPGNPDGDGVMSKSSTAGDLAGGTLTLVRKGERLSVKFLSASGRQTSVQSVTLPKDLEARLRITFGGVPTTPRRVDRVTIRTL